MHPAANSSPPVTRDTHRPGYHFLPPENWLNDPNGPIQWKGIYHLFYQHNPFAPVWGSIHWGHAQSQDLVHWEHLPLALAPTPGSADGEGCWSGYCVNNNGTPTIIYTGISDKNFTIQRPCLATSDDQLRYWVKHPGNPIIVTLPPDLDLVGFRDHTIWQENDMWFMGIGSGIKGVGGTVLLYQSRDLVSWEYLHPLFSGKVHETGEIWECPDFFPLGDKYVLILSPIPLKKAIYFIGEYKNHRFIPETQGTIDWGGHYYAPLSFLDEKNRRVLWGWLWEGRSIEAQKQAGWAGVMALPRILSLDNNHHLIQTIPEEFQQLRKSSKQLANLAVSSGSSLELEGVMGGLLEIKMTVDPSYARSFGIQVYTAENPLEYTTILYDCQTQKISIDRSHSSTDKESHTEFFESGRLLPLNGELDFHLFLDRSVIEVFGYGETCVTATTRIYPSGAAQRIKFTSKNGDTQIKSLTCWPLQPASIIPERSLLK